MLLLLLQALLISAQYNTWCGHAECPAKPQCSNSEIDLIMALDESCSMTSSDFALEAGFAGALANATEYKFSISRFSGIQFGYNLASFTPPVAKSSSIFWSMQAGAANFTRALPSNFQCGGTPTDEALYLFYDELNRTKIGTRMQVAVLLTDGIPTLCWTRDGSCTGGAPTPNTQKATNTAISQRFNSTRLGALNPLVFTVGIGAGVSTNVGTTNQYGSITGAQLLQYFASSPRMAFTANSFTELVTTTMPQVLDLLCFYVIDVESPARASCYAGGTPFVIKGYNIFPMQGTATCRWQEVGTNTYLYTTGTITVTNQTFLTEPGVVGMMNCNAPVVPHDFYNAYLEISRDGVYYTANQYSVLLRQNCSAPIPPPPCPNGTIGAFFQACTMSQLVGNNCNSDCNDASIAFGNAFQAQGLYPDFTAAQISACVVGYPSTWSDADKNAIARSTKPGLSPCSTPITSGAHAMTASLLWLAWSFLFA